MITTENIGLAIGWAITAATWITSNFFARRRKRAEVKAQEVQLADQMIDLVTKANAEVLSILRKENEKLRKSIGRLEKALRAITTCPHSDDCPVRDQLQSDTTFSDKPPESND